MFVINEDKSIYITRGDVAFFAVAVKTETGEAYNLQPGDVVRFKVYEKKACENVVLQKDFGIEEETEEVEIYLEENDTKIGEVISKPTPYWYEIELNPYTDPQTILGYDEDGPKVFTLYPEGNEAEDSEPITPEDIPVVDAELSLTSERPVQNQAIARAIIKIKEKVDAELLARSKSVDISNEFVKSYYDDVEISDLRVYKYGKVISGSFVATCIQGGLYSTRLFVAKSEYLPSTNLQLSGTTIDTKGTETILSMGSGIVAIFSEDFSSIPAGCFVSIVRDERPGILVNFTYIID